MSATVTITVAESSVVVRRGLMSVIGRAEEFKTKIYEVSEPEQLRSVLVWQTPDILIVNPAVLGLFPLQQLKKETGNPDMKCIALQLSVMGAGVLKNYDDSITIYDSADVITDKISKLINAPEDNDKRHESLSTREKDVIACVVQGMTNKQIADKLCISAHTVITHRRNISSKLGIHTPAGLTIYAIVNKLVELDEIRDAVQE